VRSRLLVAIPGIALAVAVVIAGGALFAAVVAVVALLALYELHSLTAAARPLRWAGDAGVLATIGLAWLLDDGQRGVLLGLTAGLLLAAFAALVLPRRDEVTARVATTAFGLLYIGLPFGMLVLTRELPEGAAAVANVLVGVWVFDTASYLGGRTWGRRPIAPRTSPGKTVEGAAIGLAAGTLAVVLAGLYMDWISAWQSLLLGIAICVAAYLGDLFESMLKRDAGAKDSGRLLLGHGGVLDRFDALLFAAPVAYLVTVAVIR